MPRLLQPTQKKKTIAQLIIFELNDEINGWNMFVATSDMDMGYDDGDAIGSMRH